MATKKIAGPHKVRLYPPDQNANVDEIEARNRKSANLADVPNKATARTNLDVWSRAEGETKAGATTKANAARDAAIATSNAYTDAEVQALILAQGLTWGDPREWDAGATYPPLRQVVASDGAYYVSLRETTGEDPTDPQGTAWSAVPTTLDADFRADANDPESGFVRIPAANAAYPRPLSAAAFGVPTDGVADATDELEAFFAACKSGGRLGYLQDRGYVVRRPLTIHSHMDARGAVLLYDGDPTDVALTVGDGVDTLMRAWIALPRVQNESKPGLGAWNDDTGVMLQRIQRCTVHVPEVRNFGVGLNAYAAAGGCHLNTVHLGHLLNNKVNHRIGPAPGGGSVNASTWIGGSSSHNSGEGEQPGMKHLVMVGGETSDNACNGHVFLNPQWDDNSEQVEVNVELLFASSNTFVNPRMEGRARILMHGHDSGRRSTGNVFQFGWGQQNISPEVTQGPHAGSNFVWTRNRMNQPQAVFQNPDTAWYALATGAYGDPEATYYAAQRVGRIDFKRPGDTAPRFSIVWDGVGSLPRLEWGDGTGSVDGRLSRPAGGGMSYSDPSGNKATFKVGDSAWDGDLVRLGTFRLWVDGSGRLRIKNGHPTGANDGTIVGTQA